MQVDELLIAQDLETDMRGFLLDAQADDLPWQVQEAEGTWIVWDSALQQVLVRGSLQRISSWWDGYKEGFADGAIYGELFGQRGVHENQEGQTDGNENQV